jgi:hypothetical protein
MNQPVILTTNEFYVSLIVGVRRRVASIEQKFVERNGAARTKQAFQFYINMIGACGEMAFCKLHGLYWPASINAAKGEPDVLPDWQIRTLEHHDYCLLVRKNDRDDQRFVLMTGNGPEFMYHGWMWGRDAKREEWWDDKGERGQPAFWVPQEFLNR